MGHNILSDDVVVPNLLVGSHNVMVDFVHGLMYDCLMMERFAMESTGHVFFVELLGHFNVPRVMSDDWLMINGLMNGLNLDVSNLGPVIWRCVVCPFDVLRLSIVVGSMSCNVLVWSNLWLHIVVSIILRFCARLDGNDCRNNESKSVH